MLDISFLDKIIEKYFSSQSSKPLTKNLYYLDAMKAIAIFFVIIYHSGAIQNNIVYEGSFLNYLLYFISPLIGTCVPIFFFTSGYLLLNKEANLNRIFNKMKKIVFLILFWRFFTFLIINFLTLESFNIKTLIIDTFAFRSGFTNHLWYLMALLFLYSILPILKFIFDNNLKLYLFLLFSIFTFVFGTRFLSQIFNLADILLVNYNLQQIPFNNFIGDFNFYMSSRGFGIVYFMLGGLVYRYPTLNSINFNSKYVFIIFSSLFLQFGYNALYSNYFSTLYDPVWWAYENILTIPLVFSLFLLSKKLFHSNNWVTTLFSIVGKNSLGIYLVHNIIIQLTNGLRSALLTFNPNLGIVYAMSVLISSLFITIIAMKIPFINNLLQLNYPSFMWTKHK